jgi:hypothetical protein
MTKVLIAAAAAFALFAAVPSAASEKEGCEKCAHKAAMAKADAAKADPHAAKGEAAAACACQKGDANAKCQCEPGKCDCQAKAGHGAAGHDCTSCPHHGAEKAPAKGETKT